MHRRYLAGFGEALRGKDGARIAAPLIVSGPARWRQQYHVAVSHPSSGFLQRSNSITHTHGFDTQP